MTAELWEEIPEMLREAVFTTRDGGGRDKSRGLASSPGAPFVRAVTAPETRLIKVAEGCVC